MDIEPTHLGLLRPRTKDPVEACNRTTTATVSMAKCYVHCKRPPKHNYYKDPHHRASQPRRDEPISATGHTDSLGGLIPEEVANAHRRSIPIRQQHDALVVGREVDTASRTLQAIFARRYQSAKQQGCRYCHFVCAVCSRRMHQP